MLEFEIYLKILLLLLLLLRSCQSLSHKILGGFSDSLIRFLHVSATWLLFCPFSFLPFYLDISFDQKPVLIAILWFLWYAFLHLMRLIFRFSQFKQVSNVQAISVWSMQFVANMHAYTRVQPFQILLSKFQIRHWVNLYLTY